MFKSLFSETNKLESCIIELKYEKLWFERLEIISTNILYSIYHHAFHNSYFFPNDNLLFLPFSRHEKILVDIFFKEGKI